MSELNAVDPKAPGETKLYTMDWSGELDTGVTISTSTWTLFSTEISNAGDAIVTGNLKTSILLSGGVEGQTYACRNNVTLSNTEVRYRIGTLHVQTEGVSA
jgi:hypothetical protein